MHAAPALTDEFHDRQQLATKRVLIAETDGPRRESFAAMFEEDGYEVITLSTGEELFQYLYSERALTERPDVVICDAELKGIDGAQVCLITRAHDGDLPFIVLAREGVPGAFDALELQDEAVVLPSDVKFETLREAVGELAGEP